ncbi:hypothetical protein [Faecalimonas sp.]
MNNNFKTVEVFCQYRTSVIGEPKKKGTEEEVIRWNLQRGIDFLRQGK